VLSLEQAFTKVQCIQLMGSLSYQASVVQPLEAIDDRASSIKLYSTL